MSDESVFLLREIRDKLATPPKQFNAGSAIAIAFATAFGFVLALAINDFLSQLFAKIPTGGGLLGAGIYMIVAIILVTIFLFVIYIYLEPWLSCKLGKKAKKYC